MHRLYHDFNKLFPGRTEGMRAAPLVCFGTKQDLERVSLTLEESMEVLLYEPDADTDGTAGALEVRAVVRFDAKEGCFMADFVWEDLKFYRDESPVTDA
jgi:hypothetical protein